ncbi:MAG TPA: hypothetical protein VHK65_03855 [Candidatus Dormibacteraeota bacterium]|nr:hypothetical protein [Candidatus Dormibacteraeota bacterium]
MRIAAALGLMTMLVGCGQVAPPRGATPVHFTVLTKHGGFEPGIFAATSVDDLRSQEVVAGQPAACTAADEPGCLATFSAPAGSLLVALQPAACADNHLDTVYLKNGALTFVINWNNTCPPGAAAAAVPEHWVVAVSLQSLPQTLMPLELQFSNGGKPLELAGKGLVDLRASGHGHTRSGNFSLETPPVVVKGQAEHITLTIFGLRATRVYQPWRIDIAALDQAGRVVWHQAPYDDPTMFNCLVGETNTCAAGSYSVEMPTLGVPPGVYTIRTTFALPAGYAPPSPPATSPPQYTLPSLTVEVVTA